MASWKTMADPIADAIQYTPFPKGRKFYAVDDSGSTAGCILRRERAFVDYVDHNFATESDSASLWGSDCDAPAKKFDSATWKSKHGGTQPCRILQRADALAAIQRSDVWFLLTDGEVFNNDVHQLAELAHQHGVLNVPLVFLIVGYCGSSPDSTNISVGISFFATSQDTLILFKETETGKIYVIAGKGCFASLRGSAAAQDLASWAAMPVFDDEAAFFEHCKSLKIQLAKAESRAIVPQGVNLGPEWEKSQNGPTWVDIDLLPEAGVLSDDDVSNLFAEEAFNILAVAYKTRRRIPHLRNLVQAQRVEQVTPKIEDVSGAAAIISKMGRADTTDAERKTLQEQLREAHVKNREHYQKTVSELAGSGNEQAFKKRNQLVDAALRALATVEAASFSADLLSRRSNRARRAEVVASNTTVAIKNLNLEGPSYKGFCLICCGEEEIMSICLKELDSEHVDDNTTDFALNFPLAAGSSVKNVNMVSSQNVCFQCALLGPGGRSIYKEKLKAIIPTVQYEGSNKLYINDQLYLALTNGLATGAAGMAQIFMAILEEVLNTKTWAGAGLDESQAPVAEQHEATQRRATFRWMLNQLIENTRTRQTFTELGDWVKFPEALSWVATDFTSRGVASFAITYPAAGFGKLLSLGVKAGKFSDQVLRQMRVTKVVYSMAAKYLADLLSANQTPDSGDEWKQKYLQVMYQNFNAPLIPQDGPHALVTDADVFFSHLSMCMDGVAQDWTSAEEKQRIMSKIQAILFWLIYQQKRRCTAQTFFKRIAHDQHLATAVLDPALSVPASALDALLRSIFAIQEDAEPIDAEAARTHWDVVPFKTPFGPSVLQCGIAACGHRFIALDALAAGSIPQATIEAMRKARTQHMIRVFGIRDRFEKAQTGLPERCTPGTPPSSTHTSLHMSIVRTWAEQTREQRRCIMASDEASSRELFVQDVRTRICADARGNVFRHDLETAIRDVLPSLFAVLEQALRLRGASGRGAHEYEYDFEDNTLEGKIRWEMEAMAEER
ncbi:hypothetical protein K504DRAFT_495456 [Pleomassaria siparia CBS 279.74]|uniref:Uncharacterized protein n=1 Tax=Pleomassaria siparia CBS 279.74 TaxID=1314801 RepID=A0A6G1JTV3_9PLEO|nr:hypothetical protein K504DRAFT_495456 [Pleomassaria siparia CBS 279.74]